MTHIIQIALAIAVIAVGLADFISRKKLAEALDSCGRRQEALKNLIAKDEDFYNGVVEELRADVSTLDRDSTNCRDKIREHESKINSLTSGLVPDYEKEKAAAEALDDFHDGISSILNHDPYEAIRRQRENGGAE